MWLRSFPGGSAGKESACNAGDPGLIPGSGRSPGEGIGYPLQYSGGSEGEESTCNAGDLSLIPGLGRYPGGGCGTPVFFPGESPWTRSLVGYSPCGRKESDMTEQLSTAQHNVVKTRDFAS